MRRRSLGMICALWLWAGSGCAGRIWYEKGQPKRVDTEVTTGSVARVADIERTTTGDVYVVVFDVTEIESKESVVFTTLEVVSKYRWYTEFLEFPLSMLYTLGAPFIKADTLVAPDTESTIQERKRNIRVMRWGMINPAQSMLLPRIESEYRRDLEKFRSEPITLLFTMGKPAIGVEVRVAWLGPDGGSLIETRGRTNAFGRLLVPPPPPEATQLRYAVAGQTQTQTLESLDDEGPEVTVQPAVDPAVTAAAASLPTPPPLGPSIAGIGLGSRQDGWANRQRDRSSEPDSALQRWMLARIHP